MQAHDIIADHSPGEGVLNQRGRFLKTQYSSAPPAWNEATRFSRSAEGVLPSRYSYRIPCRSSAASFPLGTPAAASISAGLQQARRSRAAQWRPAKLEPLAMKAIADGIDQYRRFWEPNFERLDHYLKSLQSGDDDGSRH
ncbi:MAG TPA: hypothetical protein DDZ81_14470 [Acetobacteraceae bacterium]|jgi:hypothetical protein|nr:hypothetical protein [Acetobacteraceae bacterium]